MKTYIVKARDNWIITMQLLMLGGVVERLTVLDNTYLFTTDATLEEIMDLNSVESVREEGIAELV